MHETSAQGWCTGKTQRDGMGREAGGGPGWGTHVNPWLIHVSVWQELGFKTEFVYETSGDEDNFYINYYIASYSNWHP